jgi:two-component system chemotaxis response regulator CheB
MHVMHVVPPLEQTSLFRHFSCPECQGSLEQVREPTTNTVSYVCRVGHSYTARELLIGKELYIEQTLWASLTALDELIVMMQELEERGQSAACTRDYRERSAIAVRLRAQLEEVIAQNEPVRLAAEVPTETDPNSRLRREG